MWRYFRKIYFIYLEHEYKSEEEEHVDDAEYGHALAGDADDKQHDDHDVYPVACAQRSHHLAECAQQTRTTLLLTSRVHYYTGTSLLTKLYSLVTVVESFNLRNDLQYVNQTNIAVCVANRVGSGHKKV